MDVRPTPRMSRCLAPYTIQLHEDGGDKFIFGQNWQTKIDSIGLNKYFLEACWDYSRSWLTYLKAKEMAPAILL